LAAFGKSWHEVRVAIEQHFWLRASILAVIGAAIIVPLLPRELRQVLGLQAAWLLGAYIPALALGGAVGWLTYSKRAWLGSTGIFLALTFGLLKFGTFAERDAASHSPKSASAVLEQPAAIDHPAGSAGISGDDVPLTDHRTASESREPAPSTPRQAWPYVDRAAEYSSKGDYDRAIAELTEAIRLDPSYVRAYVSRGAALLKKGETDRAIADFGEGIRLDPKHAEAYRSRGVAWRQKPDLDRAILDFNEAIRLNPSYARAYVSRGIAWQARADHDRAIADYNEAIRLDPKIALAYFNRGAAWERKGNLDRAIADYSDAIRLDPKRVHAYANRGWLLCKKGIPDKALNDFRQALTLEPGNEAAVKGMSCVEQAIARNRTKLPPPTSSRSAASENPTSPQRLTVASSRATNATCVDETGANIKIEREKDSLSITYNNGKPEPVRIIGQDDDVVILEEEISENKALVFTLTRPHLGEDLATGTVRATVLAQDKKTGEILKTLGAKCLVTAGFWTEASVDLSSSVAGRRSCPKASQVLLTELQECAAFFAVALDGARRSANNEALIKKLNKLALDTVAMSTIPGDQLKITRADQKAGTTHALERISEAVKSKGASALSHYEDTCEALHDSAGQRFRKLLAQYCQRDAPDFVEVGEAGIAVDHAMRRQLAVQRS
jgi:tetratricopeptide (TPR) repeat protein